MPPFEMDSRTKTQGMLFSVATAEPTKFGKPLSFYTEGLISENERNQGKHASLAKNRNWVFKEKKKIAAAATTGTSSQIRISKNVAPA